VDSFSKAASSDPGGPLEFVAKKEIQQIETFVEKLVDHIAKKGRVKIKRLLQMTQAITNKPHETLDRHRFTEVELPALISGSNDGAVIICKVVEIISKDFLPVTLSVLDGKGNMGAVSIYNVSSGAVHSGDLMTIYEPFVKAIALDYNNKHLSYVCAQVQSTNIILNDKRDVTVFAPTEVVLDQGIDEGNSAKKHTKIATFSDRMT